MKKTTLLIVFTTFSLFTLKAQSTPKEFVDTFFKTFKESGSTKALDDLYSTNKWVAEAEEAVSNLKTQMEALTEDYVGKFYGYELINQKKLADSYLLMSYLVKYDRQPIRFTFQFYKPNKIWKIQSFQFDTSLDTELEEAAKVYNISK